MYGKKTWLLQRKLGYNDRFLSKIISDSQSEYKEIQKKARFFFETTFKLKNT